jgi:hypothetical protein
MEWLVTRDGELRTRGKRVAYFLEPTKKRMVERKTLAVATTVAAQPTYGPLIKVGRERKDQKMGSPYNHVNSRLDPYQETGPLDPMKELQSA